MKQLMKLTKINDELFLDGMKLTGWENYRIIQDSALPRGKAELEIKIVVEFPGNTQEEPKENYLPLSKSHTAE